MKIYTHIYIFFICLTCLSQSRVGDWEIYLNYSSVNSISCVEEVVYAGTETQFFRYNNADNSISAFSKLNGLSDINISAIKYDQEINVVVIGYQNGNVDLFYPNGVVNIPYIKEANIMGSKKN